LARRNLNIRSAYGTDMRAQNANTNVSRIVMADAGRLPLNACAHFERSSFVA
jgi:hypothetical protein